MSRKIPREEIIERFNKVHNNRYDYSELVYTKRNSKVNVICPKHGVFSVAVQNHEEGAGCPSCRKISMRKTTEQFIADANRVHNNFYNYSESVYEGACSKVKIICPTHGLFEQVANSHTGGKGCPKCAHDATSLRCRGTLEHFIRKSKEQHGDTYDYSKVKYVSGHTKVIINCKTHGDFLQKPNHHWDGIGCPKCGKEAVAKKLMMGNEEFITRAKEVHGDLYSYSKVNYKNSGTKLIVTCKIHGDWSTTPSNHLIGSGCPACGMKETGFNDNKISSLYVLVADDRTKVGITNRDVDKRLREIKSDSQINFKILKMYSGIEGGVCRDIESNILKLLSGKYPNITGSFSGSTECFVGVDNAWLLNTLDVLMKEKYGKKN